MVTFKVHSLHLHTPFPMVLPLFVVFLERSFGMSFKAKVSALWMSSVDSKLCPFSAYFTFWNKKMSQGGRSVIKEAEASPQCVLISKSALKRTSHCCSEKFLGTISAELFSSPVLQSVSNGLFPSSCSLLQQSFWLSIFDRIEKVLLPVLCCHLSILLMVVSYTDHFQQRFLPSENILWHCIISKSLLKFSMCSGGIRT